MWRTLSLTPSSYKTLCYTGNYIVLFWETSWLHVIIYYSRAERNANIFNGIHKIKLVSTSYLFFCILRSKKVGTLSQM